MVMKNVDQRPLGTLLTLLGKRAEKLAAQLDDGTGNRDRYPFRDAVAMTEISRELRRRFILGRLKDI